MSRLQMVGSYVIILAVALSGGVSGHLWPLLFAGAVVLLVLADRGQHQALIEHVEGRNRPLVAALSIGAHLVNNLLFCALAFGLGRLSRLVWFDVMDGRDGAWLEVALWCLFQLVLFGLLELFDRLLRSDAKN
jgi:hypothetical protein